MPRQGQKQSVASATYNCALRIRPSDPLLANGRDDAQKRRLRLLAFLLVDRHADLNDSGRVNHDGQQQRTIQR